jgi:hypothetical protein
VSNVGYQADVEKSLSLGTLPPVDVPSSSPASPAIPNSAVAAVSKPLTKDNNQQLFMDILEKQKKGKKRGRSSGVEFRGDRDSQSDLDYRSSSPRSDRERTRSPFAPLAVGPNLAAVLPIDEEDEENEMQPDGTLGFHSSDEDERISVAGESKRLKGKGKSPDEGDSGVSEGELTMDDEDDEDKNEEEEELEGSHDDDDEDETAKRQPYLQQSFSPEGELEMSRQHSRKIPSSPLGKFSVFINNSSLNVSSVMRPVQVARVVRPFRNEDIQLQEGETVYLLHKYGNTWFACKEDESMSASYIPIDCLTL